MFDFTHEKFQPPAPARNILRNTPTNTIVSSPVKTTKRKPSAAPVGFNLMAEPNWLPTSEVMMQQGHARIQQQKPLAPDSAKSPERHIDTAINVVLKIVAHLAAVSTDALPLPEELTILSTFILPLPPAPVQGHSGARPDRELPWRIGIDLAVSIKGLAQRSSICLCSPLPPPCN